MFKDSHKIDRQNFVHISTRVLAFENSVPHKGQSVDHPHFSFLRTWDIPAAVKSVNNR